MYVSSINPPYIGAFLFEKSGYTGYDCSDIFGTGQNNKRRSVSATPPKERNKNDG
jgi:hypothetical protein